MTTTYTKRIYHKNSGFTLVEIAIVLLIITLLMAGLVPTISSQVEQRQVNETRKQLDDIQQALIGYAVTNGRLPCPASATSYGAESFASGGNAGNGNCSNFHDGFVPAVTLGLSPVDSQGFAIDSWNNRIHYAVTSANGNAFTKFPNGISLTSSADLYVCSTASATTSCSVANSTLTSAAPAVIYSVGKNGAYGGTGADEAENPNPNSADNDQVFVSHTPTAAGSANGEFDDLVIWLSSNTLFNRMVMAGKLP